MASQKVCLWSISLFFSLTPKEKVSFCDGIRGWKCLKQLPEATLPGVSTEWREFQGSAVSREGQVFDRDGRRKWVPSANALLIGVAKARGRTLTGLCNSVDSGTFLGKNTD